MPQAVGPMDHGSTSPLVVAIAAATPHVVSYRLWTRHGASEWTLLGEGSTAIPGPHQFDVPIAAGLQLYYWIGVAGAPESPFECAITVAQAGALLPHGAMRIRGQTDAKGVAAVQDWVNVS